MSILPRYPVYVPSKGRHENCLTAKFLAKDGVPFRLVVEPKERDAYAALFGPERILVLPWDNPPGTREGLIKARNWIKAHSIAEGHARHWQLDDNIRYVMRRHRAKRLRCQSGPAFACVEDFVDRYENVALAGMNYAMFVADRKVYKPFWLNVHVYSGTLVLNRIPNCWRLAYNDDTDICLQVLADGWCTVLFNAFVIHKMQTMKHRGGNTTIYQGDGRLKMARALEQAWPHVVAVDRRFKRPQHVVADQWKSFKTPLKRRADLDWSKFPATDDYGLELRQVKDEVRSPLLKGMLGEKPPEEKGKGPEAGT